jgi:colicin import membrane protein
MQKFIDAKADELIMKGINYGLDLSNKHIIEALTKNTIAISKDSKTVEEIILKKEKKRLSVEEALRQHKIKDIQENKESIENKIKSLEENIKLLENEPGAALNISKIQGSIDLNSSQLLGKEVVEDNIRRSRIKEIKQSKEILEKKLFSLDEQVQHLMNEEETNQQKKFNLKQYLDNFEKDKRDAEARAKKWEQERETRLKNMIEQRNKFEIRAKKMDEKSIKEYQQKESQKNKEYQKNLEKLKVRSKDFHEEVEKLKEEWKNKNITEQEYLFEKIEKDFREKQEQMDEDKKNNLMMELLKKRSQMKPIRNDEIDEFKRKYEEDRTRLIIEKENVRLTKIEEIQNINSNLPKPDTQSYQKAIEEEKKIKELREKEKLDKIYKNMKIKQFSKVIKSEMQPKIDEVKKKELAERISKLNNNPITHHHKRKHKRVLLKKPDPSKPKKYNWELKLNQSIEERSPRGSGSRSARSNSHRSLSKKKNNDILDEEEIINNRELKKKIQRSKSAEKRKPLDKLPDYLTEIRIKKINNEKPATGDALNKMHSK